MVKLYDKGVYLVGGTRLAEEENQAEAFAGKPVCKEEARKGTIAYSIMEAHNTSGNMDKLKIKFDAMASHDITFVGIIQTAKASGMEKFPIPYVLTNCHNSLCAVGGTINEDDHMFGLSAAKKYGGIYVPPHIAVIHQYMREMFAGCGKMILGSDSHTRYGALGTMAIGEGGGELVKQLLCDTYDVNRPEVIAIYLDGKPNPWVGPQDIALAIIGAVFKNGYVKNKVMEFVGPGVSTMTTDYRNGIDVMTTETTCLSSVWRTDEDTRAFLTLHGRGEDYNELNPADVAYYDGCVYVDLSTVKPMIAPPFHPSNTYEIDELNANLGDILREVEKEAAHVGNGRADYTLTDKIVDGKLKVQQGVIAGCAGGNYTNVVEAANVLRGKTVGTENFHLRCILLRSRYLSIWQEKELRQTLWKLEQSSVQLSVDRALVQAIRRAITDSVSVIRPEISRTEKDPNQETDRCQPLRLWMPVPSQQQRQTRDSLHQQKNLTAGERYRNILLTILFTETAFIMVSRRAMRRKIWYTDRISKTGRK